MNLRLRHLLLVLLFAMMASGCAGDTNSTDVSEAPEIPPAFNADDDESEADSAAPAATATAEPTPVPEPTAVLEPAAPEEPTLGGAPCTDSGDRNVIELLPVDWQVGTGRSYTLDSSDGEVSASTPIDLAVIESADAGYTMRWTFGRTEIQNVPLESRALIEAMQQLNEGLAVDYNVSPEGWFEGLANKEALETELRDAMDSIVETTATSATEEAEMKQVFDELFANPEFVDVAATQDVTILHSVYGVILGPDEVFTSDETLPNAFGGSPFPATTTVSGRSDDNGCAVVELVTVPDPDQFGTILLDSLAELSGVPADEISDEQRELFTNSEIRTEITVVFDEGTGWPRQITSTKSVIVGETSQIETKVLTDNGPVSG